MENMDKRLTVPKWLLIVWPKIPQMHQNLSAQFLYPIPKVLGFNEKRLHWAFVGSTTLKRDQLRYLVAELGVVQYIFRY